MNAARKIRKNTRDDMFIFVLVVLFAAQIIYFVKNAPVILPVSPDVIKKYELSDVLHREQELQKTGCSDIHVAYTESAVLIEGKTEKLNDLFGYIMENPDLLLIRTIRNQDYYSFSLRLK